MPTQDGLVSYDLVCTVCENKVFGFRGEYGKLITCFLYTILDKYFKDTLLTFLLFFLFLFQVARLKLKEIDGRAPPGT